MQGAPSWPEITWIVTLIAGVFMAAFVLAWRISEIRSKDNERAAKDRHDLRAAFEQKVQGLDDRFDLVERSFTTRLTAIETFNAGTVVVLDHMEKFKDEIKKQLDEIQKERRESTNRIMTSLASLHNTTRGLRFTPEGEEGGGS